MTAISSSAFSRVSASAAIAAPSANHRPVDAPDPDPCDQPQRQAHEEHVEHGLLQQAVEKDRRRPERERQAGDEADALREQARAGEAEQHARRRSDERLDDADDQQVASEDRVDDTEKVGIERRLVEDVGADPVAGGQPHGPLVIAVGVAEQGVEEGSGAQLPDVDQSDGEGDDEDDERVA